MRLTDIRTGNRPRLRKTRKLIVFVVLMLLGLNAVAKLIAQSPSPQTLSGTFQVINNAAGDQTSPDLDCNLISYTNNDFQGSSFIHYQAPPANTDFVVPGNGLDTLSDVAGNRIAFTEVNAVSTGIAVFDAVTQFRTDIPGVARSRPAIGADLVAYEDRSFFAAPNQSELGVYDLSTGTDIRLTNDLLFDKNPTVSPTGNAVVWEKCQTDGFGCNIYSAVQTSPGVFTTRALTSAVENRNPDTNGQIAVYISNRTGENDIYSQPLTGGAETRIAIPGDQRDLSISGNLISFESQVQLGSQTEYDIFVYNLSNANLYQVTNTSVDESDSRIAFCNGVGRIAYVSPGVDFDVYAFSFQLPSSPPPAPSPADQINALIALVRSFNLSPALETTLVGKLQDALAAVNANDTATACSSLTSFISKVQSQSNKKITPEQKSQLITSANQIKTNLGCP
ncbi:MAG TPA: hypothetical protein VF075_05500 [Pyrinomonadaceae bacterium]